MSQAVSIDRLPCQVWSEILNKIEPTDTVTLSRLSKLSQSFFVKIQASIELNRINKIVLALSNATDLTSHNQNIKETLDTISKAESLSVLKQRLINSSAIFEQILRSCSNESFMKIASQFPSREEFPRFFGNVFMLSTFEKKLQSIGTYDPVIRKKDFEDLVNDLIRNSLPDKAEIVLQQIESRVSSETCISILAVNYVKIGKPEKLEELRALPQSNPKMITRMHIDGLLQLGKLDEAEQIVLKIDDIEERKTERLVFITPYIKIGKLEEAREIIRSLQHEFIIDRIDASNSHEAIKFARKGELENALQFIRLIVNPKSQENAFFFAALELAKRCRLDELQKTALEIIGKSLNQRSLESIAIRLAEYGYPTTAEKFLSGINGTPTEIERVQLLIKVATLYRNKNLTNQPKILHYLVATASIEQIKDQLKKLAD